MQDVRYTGNSKQQYSTIILRQLFHTKMLSMVLPVVNFSINLVLQTFLWLGLFVQGGRKVPGHYTCILGGL